MAKNHKKTGGEITIENLARMTQDEFAVVRDELKSGFNNIREETTIVKEDIGILRRDTEAGFHGVSEGMKAIMAKLNSIQEDVIEIHDLRARVERLEKKVGLQK